MTAELLSLRQRLLAAIDQAPGGCDLRAAFIGAVTEIEKTTGAPRTFAPRAERRAERSAARALSWRGREADVHE